MPVIDGLIDIIDKVGTEFEFGGTGKFVSEATDQPYWIKARFHSDTIVTGPGNLIDVSGAWYLVVSFIPEMFENQIVQYRAILLTCNFVFSLQRENEERNENYELEVTWPNIMTDCRGARLDAAGQQLAEERIGDLKLESDVIYVPAEYGVEINDRLVSASPGDKYKVESVKDDQFPGVLILQTGEDNR